MLFTTIPSAAATPLSRLEEQVWAEARQNFAEPLKQLSAGVATIQRLERNMVVMALAANIAATKPAKPVGDFIQADDGGSWCRSVDLMDNIYLCQRATATETEYAVVKCSPGNDVNEVWYQGFSAIQVLQLFAGEQRQALQIWAEDLAAQMRKYLVGKYPSRDLGDVADNFMRQFFQTVPPPSTPASEPGRGRDARA
jgi:hypothetical protein